jgi:hypothetical protein
MDFRFETWLGDVNICISQSIKPWRKMTRLELHSIHFSAGPCCRFGAFLFLGGQERGHTTWIEPHTYAAAPSLMAVDGECLHKADFAE